MLTAALFMGFSKMAKSFEMILLGRLLYGIGIGSYMGLGLVAVGSLITVSKSIDSAQAKFCCDQMF